MQPGDQVPDLMVTTETGERHALSALRRGQAAVLFFYPKDDTPLCTKEACSFRDAFEDFVEAGAVVLGVSADTPDSHRAFQRRHVLPYTLLSDEDGALRKAFAVPRVLGLLDGRVTYVIDREGVVRHVFNARFAAERHVTEALAVVRKLVEAA